MKLNNRTILLVGNELHFTLNLIQHYLKLHNKIILISNCCAVHEKIRALFPSVILLNLDICRESDHLILVDELNKRHLSPSCVVYNEFFLSKNVSAFINEINLQSKLESFFTSVTHLDECLFPFLETEADATVAFVFPTISLFDVKRRKLTYIIEKTITSYISNLNTIHPHIRFLTLKKPIFRESSLLKKAYFNPFQQSKNFLIHFKQQLERTPFPIKKN